RRRSHGTGDSGTGSSPSTSHCILRTCVLNLSLDNRPVPMPSIPPGTKTPQKCPVAVPGPCRLLLDRVPWGGELGRRGLSHEAPRRFLIAPQVVDGFLEKFGVVLELT